MGYWSVSKFIIFYQEVTPSDEIWFLHNAYVSLSNLPTCFLKAVDCLFICSFVC